MSKLLTFEGHNYLRQRLVLATLSGKYVRIDKIRSDDENPGIRGGLHSNRSFFISGTTF